MLDSLTTLALAKSVKEATEKLARADVTVGTHPIDVVLHIKGSLVVAPDTEKKPTSSIPFKEVLALFIARSGCTRESAVSLLRSCLTDALNHGVTGEGAVEAAAAIDEVFKAEVAALTASLPKTPVKGAVKASLAVEVVNAAEYQIAAK